MAGWRRAPGVQWCFCGGWSEAGRAVCIRAVAGRKLLTNLSA